MKRWELIIWGALILAGCHDPIDGKNFYLSSKEKSGVVARCKELNAIGIKHEARAEIASDMRKIKKIIGQDDLLSSKDEIVRLSDRIKDNSDRLMQMAKSEYIENSYRQRLVWNLGRKDFGLSEKPGKHLWKIRAARIVGVYNWQGENDALANRVELSASDDGVVVKLQRTASLIEICQLQETIVIALEVDFQQPFEKKTGTYRLLAKNLE